MAKAKKRARNKASKSVKTKAKRKPKGKQTTAKRKMKGKQTAAKAKSKARRSGKRAPRPAAAKRRKPVERREAPTAPVEMTIATVEQPAPGVVVVEEFVVREEGSSAVGNSGAEPAPIDYPRRGVA